jgi:hypothetical protein
MPVISSEFPSDKEGESQPSSPASEASPAAEKFTEPDPAGSARECGGGCEK